MKKMVEILDAQYPAHREKGNGIIQFHFSYKNQEWPCHIIISGMIKSPVKKTNDYQKNILSI